MEGENDIKSQDLVKMISSHRIWNTFHISNCVETQTHNMLLFLDILENWFGGTDSVENSNLEKKYDSGI